MKISSLCSLVSAILPIVLSAHTIGSWSATGSGVTVEVYQQNVSSPLLTAPQNLSSSDHITSYRWYINPLNEIPNGLDIHLCHLGHCTELSSLSGHGEAFAGLPASGNYYFVYQIQGAGRLSPPFTVVSNRLTVNYQ